MNFTSYLGDEALAALVHLSGGELADYGFAQPGIPVPKYSDRPLFGWGVFAPSEDEIEKIRQQAIERWRAR